MRKIVNFIKKYWLLFVFLLLLVIVFIYRLSPETGDPVTTPPTALEVYKASLKPGETGTEELENILGKPLSTFTRDDYLVYEYPSQFPKYHTEIYGDNNLVVFIKEPVKYEEGRKIDIYRQSFGQPEAILYSEEVGPSFSGHIYPQKGLAVFAHQADGTIIEVWYFKPTSLSNFVSTWGKDLKEEPYDEPEVLIP